MSTKSKLYELIQLSQNSKYPIKLDRPLFEDSDDFNQKDNTHNMTCTAKITINNKDQTFTSDVFPNKKAANNDVCTKILNYITELETNISSQPKPQQKSKNISQLQNTSNTSDIKIIINRHLLILIDYENVSNEKEMRKLEDFLTKVNVLGIMDNSRSDSPVMSDFSDDDDYSNYEDILELSEESNVQSNKFEELANSSDSLDDYWMGKGIEIIKFAGYTSSMKAKADVVVKSTRKDAVDHYISFYLGKTLGEYPTMADTHSIHILSRDHFASCLADFNSNVVHNVDVDDLIESISNMTSKHM